MWAPDRIIASLTARGDLWQPAPGVVGLRGDTLALFTALERAIGSLAQAETRDEWRVPQAIPLEVLARAEYFASFPQWLTLASHLDDDEAVLSRVAADEHPAAAARRAAAPADAALPPAVCYHVYAALAGGVVASPTLLTAQGTCWRHEGARHAPLERGWAFTMREIVCLGSSAETKAFRARVVPRAMAFAAALGLDATVVEASDPFFAPTARGKALLQRVKALKHELLLPLGDGRRIAAASFNLHEGFFGEAFNIRLAGGDVAATACVAFGLERWLLAVLTSHGPDSRHWPAVDGSLVADGVA
jgi:seryl-tRNA synthetase